MKRTFIRTLFAILATAIIGSAQTTEFTYQGSLKEGTAPANGSYDFELCLFDDPASGTQVGTLATRSGVAVADGIFTVKLDFGVVFNGADRFLEIRLRNADASGFTVLDPRQKLGSSPYAVKSLSADNATTANNATQLGRNAANQYLLTTGTGSHLTNLNTPSITNGIENARLGVFR